MISENYYLACETWPSNGFSHLPEYLCGTSQICYNPLRVYLLWLNVELMSDISSAGVCMWCFYLSSDEESSVTEAHECECNNRSVFSCHLSSYLSSYCVIDFTTGSVQNNTRENSSVSIQCPKLTFFHTCLTHLVETIFCMIYIFSHTFLYMICNIIYNIYLYIVYIVCCYIFYVYTFS